MSQTVGIGITTSAGGGPFAVAVQRALIYDSATSNWYYVETTFTGVGASLVPVDGSFDVIALHEGRNVNDLSGYGSFGSAGIVASAGLIYNSSGELIGWQGSAQTNIAINYGTTFTTVRPWSDVSPDITNPLMAALIAAMIAGSSGGPYGALAGAGFALLLYGIINPLINWLFDPLSLDLDGDGIELISLANSSVNFDLDGNGFAERTGWVSSDDGILVRDGNRNGSVDSVAELFGSATQDGFAVLETFDDNHDGKIDALDAVFADLKVWRDLNQNGVSEAGELFMLSQLGIQSISVQTQDVTGTRSTSKEVENLIAANDDTRDYWKLVA